MKFIHFGCWNKGLCVFLNKVNNQYNYLVHTENVNSSKNMSASEASAENIGTTRNVSTKYSNMSYVLQSLRNNIKKIKSRKFNRIYNYCWR